MNYVERAMKRLEEARDALSEARINYEQIFKFTPIGPGSGLEPFEAWKTSVKRLEQQMSLAEFRLRDAVDTVLWTWRELREFSSNE